MILKRTAVCLVLSLLVSPIWADRISSDKDGKPRYLDYLPRVWTYLNRDLDHPAMVDLKAWYDRTIPRDVRGNVKG